MLFSPLYIFWSWSNLLLSSPLLSSPLLCSPLLSLPAFSLETPAGRAILQKIREEFKQIVHEEVAAGVRHFASSRRASRASDDTTQPEVYLPEEGKERR